MPWYQSKPHIWRNFLVFVAISQIWHIEIRPNSHRLFVLDLSYYLESFKKIVYWDLQIYAMVPLTTTYLEIFFVFVAIPQIWHIKIRPNSHRLTVLVLSYYLDNSSINSRPALPVGTWNRFLLHVKTRSYAELTWTTISGPPCTKI